MAKVEFLSTTLTSKGRFGKGDICNKFTEDEAKDLQRLSSVKSPENTPVKKENKKPAKAKASKKEE